MSKEKIIESIDSAIKSNIETDCLEFKDGSNGFSGNQVWNTLSAFSHRPDGGLIVYGVRENVDKSFTVVGVENAAIMQ